MFNKEIQCCKQCSHDKFKGNIWQNCPYTEKHIEQHKNTWNTTTQQTSRKILTLLEIYIKFAMWYVSGVAMVVYNIWNSWIFGGASHICHSKRTRKKLYVTKQCIGRGRVHIRPRPRDPMPTFWENFKTIFGPVINFGRIGRVYKKRSWVCVCV